jgi:hypothetical protein
MGKYLIHVLEKHPLSFALVCIIYYVMDYVIRDFCFHTHLFLFLLFAGVGQVIKGWDVGINGNS